MQRAVHLGTLCRPSGVRCVRPDIGVQVEDVDVVQNDIHRTVWNAPAIPFCPVSGDEGSCWIGWVRGCRCAEVEPPRPGHCLHDRVAAVTRYSNHPRRVGPGTTRFIAAYVHG